MYNTKAEIIKKLFLYRTDCLAYVNINKSLCVYVNACNYIICVYLLVRARIAFGDGFIARESY